MWEVIATIYCQQGDYNVNIMSLTATYQQQSTAAAAASNNTQLVATVHV